MNGRCAADLTTPTILGTPVLFHRKTYERVSTFGALPIPPGRGRVDSDVRCNPVDSIGSSTESRVSHSEPRLLLGFRGTKTARREGTSSPFSDAGVALRVRTQGRFARASSCGKTMGRHG